MKKTYANIVGCGSYVPDKVLSNADLSKMVETTDEWITSRTGIRERRIAASDQGVSDLAVPAIKNALAQAKISAEDLELIVVGTCSPDYQVFPSTGCVIQDKIGAKNAAAFDVSAACSGFIFALSIAQQYIENGTHKHVLVVGADELSKSLNWKDRGTCVLFGDGAGAVVLNPNTEYGILSTHLGVVGSGGKHLLVPGGGTKRPMSQEVLDQKLNTIQMNGKEVFRFAVWAVEESLGQVLAKTKVKKEDLKLFIPHQANMRIINHAIKHMGFPKEKVYANLDRYGNTSAASIPLALDEAFRNGKIKKGDLIAACGFGAGLTYGAALIKWGI
ncbi:MAG: beta-ketoacyl-ACP synthase III [bacterium]